MIVQDVLVEWEVIMTREKLAEIFNETQEKFLAEKLNGDKVKESLSHLYTEDGKISSSQMAIFAYVEGFKMSVDFMWEILMTLVEDEAEQKETDVEQVAKKVIEYGCEVQKTTGKNPFDF